MVSEDWDQDSFEQMVKSAFKDEFALQSELFRLRAQQLLSQSPMPGGQAALSGLLIGADLVATPRLWQDKSIGIVGASDFAAHYAFTLYQMGAAPIITDSSTATLAGLKQMYQEINKDAACHET